MVPFEHLLPIEDRWATANRYVREHQRLLARAFGAIPQHIEQFDRAIMREDPDGTGSSSTERSLDAIYGRARPMAGRKLRCPLLLVAGPGVDQAYVHLWNRGGHEPALPVIAISTSLMERLQAYIAWAVPRFPAVAASCGRTPAPTQFRGFECTNGAQIREYSRGLQDAATAPAQLLVGAVLAESLRFIILHEFGHLLCGHTSGSIDAEFASMSMERYERQYAAERAAVSRGMELHADACAVEWLVEEALRRVLPPSLPTISGDSSMYLCWTALVLVMCYFTDSARVDGPSRQRREEDSTHPSWRTRFFWAKKIAVYIGAVHDHLYNRGVARGAASIVKEFNAVWRDAIPVLDGDEQAGGVDVVDPSELSEAQQKIALDTLFSSAVLTKIESNKYINRSPLPYVHWKGSAHANG